MKIISQEDETGCALACVAMVAGKTYAEVKQTAAQLGIKVKDKKLYSETKYVRRLLSRFGIQASDVEKPFVGWGALPDTALLSIKYHRENSRNVWHWVAFERKQEQSAVFDPAKYVLHHRRTDFGAMKPKWFIAILEQ
ncbi:MAG TPA: cysteine peptidase family C39 domain-containing protein [Verrucomicrobiae bacterium]|jgi:ABC-type bacteriocin/lantibiotic exporter with double-glycine peptidase domain|nr:cysteine peptidase family C39 domain-containing protein [Verrucomicrobiae bacterium]